MPVWLARRDITKHCAAVKRQFAAPEFQPMTVDIFCLTQGFGAVKFTRKVWCLKPGTRGVATMYAHTPVRTPQSTKNVFIASRNSTVQYIDIDD